MTTAFEFPPSASAVDFCYSESGVPAPKAATSVAASTPPPKHLDISKGTPLRRPSHSRISSLSVRARVPFVFQSPLRVNPVNQMPISKSGLKLANLSRNRS